MRRFLVTAAILAIGANLMFAADDSVEKTKKLAEVLQNKQCFKEAIKEYLKLVYLTDDVKYAAEAEYMVGECLQKSEKYWRAIGQWNDVLNKYPGTEWASKAKESIKRITTIIEDVNRKVQYPLSLREKLAYMYVIYGNDFAGRCWVTSSLKRELEKNEIDTAKYWYEKVAQDYKDTYLAPYALEKMGTMYYNGEEKQYYVEAVNTYNRIPELFPDRPLWALRGLRLAGDAIRDKLKKKDSLPVYQKMQELAGQQIGENSFYRKYAETQINVVK